MKASMIKYINRNYFPFGLIGPLGVLMKRNHENILKSTNKENIKNYTNNSHNKQVNSDWSISLFEPIIIL